MDFFYKNFQDIFVGINTEGQGGFINLTKIKSKYYEKIERLLTEDMEEIFKKHPTFKDKLLNDLYLFFSKYIAENGSIYSKEAYSDPILFIKTQPLYYIKTDKLFKSKTVEINGIKFYFDASTIENKKNNEKRSLIYELKEIKEDKTIVFKVYYKENSADVKIDEILKEIKKKIEGIEKKDLEKAFNIFKRQPEMDFFINKNAKTFLQEQFNLWICQHFWRNNKEWSLDKLEYLQILKDIAFKIIDFVNQFEDELVKIWNKPKFTRNSNYVITLDRMALLGNKGIEIIRKLLLHSNMKHQIEEWKELEIVNDNFSVEDVIKENHLSDKYQFLPIDTKYFKDLELEILNLFDDLDNDLDGWLIKSENYQALNTLLSKFKGRVKVIYIDPPFNLESSDQFHYRTNYKDSVWAIFLKNRLELAKDWLSESGSIFVRCDYNGNWIVRYVMDEIFGRENFRNEIIINKTRVKQQTKNQFIQQTESLFFYSKSEKILINKIERAVEPKWQALLHFPRAECKPRVVLGKVFYPPKNRRWAISQERINEFESKGKVRINENLSYIDCKGNKVSGVPEVLYDAKIVGNEWLDIPGYSQTQHFPTENSESLLKRVIQSTSNKNDLVMDFFLGSGTTTAVAHKLRRKWIGIEMGEHFYTVILPRMKRVLAYDKSGISKDEDVREKYSKKNAGGFFKYYELEQYEEVLANTTYLDSDVFIEEILCRKYIFMKDKKTLEVLEKEYKNRKIEVDLYKLYSDIDIIETLSNLTGKWIRKVGKDYVEFEDNSKINIKDLSCEFIKPLILWK
ncbi:MAG: site-specific DNA-methyltransferase [Sulfurihydrogenibium sp.]|jgi:hypothetical protein|nr:site-specific DNA-methyltransferase [Sulfurihydrogenibium sp.]